MASLHLTRCTYPRKKCGLAGADRGVEVRLRHPLPGQHHGDGRRRRDEHRGQLGRLQPPTGAHARAVQRFGIVMSAGTLSQDRYRAALVGVRHLLSLNNYTKMLNSPVTMGVDERHHHLPCPTLRFVSPPDPEEWDPGGTPKSRVEMSIKPKIIISL